MEEKKIIFLNLLNENKRETNKNKVQEKELIDQLGSMIVHKLKENEYIIYKNETDDKIDQIIEISNKIRPDIHISLQATRKLGNNTKYGPNIYTNKFNALGEKLSQKIYDQLKLIYYDLTYNKGVQDTNQIGEVVKIKSPISYLDLFYYDDEQDYEWFIENLEGIGNAIFIGIENYFKDRD